MRVGAGVVWDDFVGYCADRGWYGVENLSLIPGAGQDSGISVEPVRPVGSTKARQEQFVLADGEALKGTAREDLKERFAAVIGIGQTQLEVVEVE